jgi:hypothetical protein
MSSTAGPSIATSGLALNVDMYNTKKSWKGAPATNLYPIDNYSSWPSQTVHFWNGNNWVVDSTYTDPGVPGPTGVYIGKVRKYTSGALSATWSGNSYAYILKTAAMTSGQSYAMSSYIYMSSNCDIDSVFSSIEGASVAAMTGGYATAYDNAKKGTWQRTGLTGTAAGNVNYIPAYAYKTGVTTGVFTGFFMVGGAMVETGTFPTPYTDGTRSNTQAIVDLTGNITLTATSLTYASDGTFSFGGTSGYISAGTPAYQLGNIDFTVSFFLKVSVATGNFGIMLWGSGPNNGGGKGVEIRVLSSQLGYTINDGVGSGTRLTYDFSNIADGVWKHITITQVKQGTAYIYLNGVAVSSQSYAAEALYTDTLPFVIGKGWDGYLNGSLSTFQLYNRALSATEVAQNFNSMRSRYGI